MSDGNTNDSVYIQKLFTSRDNFTQGNVQEATANTLVYVGNVGRIWWNPVPNAFYYSDGNTPGGILITGGSTGNGTVGGANTYVQYNNAGNFAGDPNFTFNSSTSTLSVTNIIANSITGGAGGSNTQVLFNDSGNINGNSQFTFNKASNVLTMTGSAYLGNVYPSANNISNLGSATARFNDLWLGSGSINLIDDTLNINQEINAINGNLVISGGNGLIFGQFEIYGNTIATTTPTANINIGLVGDTGYVDIERPISVNSTGGGSPAFIVEQTGLVAVRVGTQAANTPGAMNITGSAGNLIQPVKNSGGMLHITGNDGAVSRITNDAFGTGSFPAYISRAGRGTAAAPSAIISGDILSRYSTVGWGTTDFPSGPAATNIEVYARETFTDSAQGTEYRFFTAPVGSTTKTLSTTIANNGVSFANSSTQTTPADIGITFRDGTRQTTAYDPANVVNSLTAGAGIGLSATTGDITITNTGVLGVTGTTNQINVGNVGNVLTLSLPQNLNTTANVILNQLTVNDLVILGNVSNVVPSVVSGKIVYVANNATTYNGIDVSGLYSGNAANNYYAAMLYTTSSNTWDMSIGNSTGITSNTIYSTNIIANANLHVGNASNDYDFPNALIQGDLNIDGYGQFVLKNHSQTANASADIVAVANNGDDGSFYIDMGINSNVYANADYAVTGANDGYLYVNGGNLVIGTQTAAKVINFFTGGTNSASYIRGTLSDTGLSMVGNVTANNMISTNATIGGTVSAVGNVTGGNLNTTGIANVSVLNVVSQANVGTTLGVAGNISGGNLRTTGLVSATGNIIAGNINTLGIVSAASAVVTANIAAGNITAAIISTTGNITGPNITATILQVAALLSVSGNIQGGNFLTSGLISTTGNVTASYFLGDGGQLSNISVAKIANGTTQVNIPTASGNANITVGGTSNVAVFSTTGEYITGLFSASGNVIGGNLVGQNLTPTRVTFVGSGKEIDDDAEFTYNDTTNTLSVGNISATGNVTAAYFNGNGSGLTGTVGGSRYYGQFWDTTTQTNAGATAANPMTFDTSDSFNTGVSIAVGNTSHVVIANPGVYNLQFSAQFAKTDSGQDTVSVWLAKDGVNVPDSCSDIDLNNNNARSIAAWNWLVNPTVANTYYQIYWSSSDTNMSIIAEGARINPTRPAIPSVILTVTQA